MTCVILGVSLAGAPASLWAEPTSVPTRRAPAVEIGLKSRASIAMQDGMVYGMGVSLIANGPAVAALAVLPIVLGARTVSKGLVGFLVGDRLITLGVLAGAAGLAEIGGGIYLTNKYRKLRPADPVLRRAWDAGLLKGTGIIYVLHGLLHITVATPLLALDDDHLQDLFGQTTAVRVGGYVGMAVGGLSVAVGTVLGTIGYAKAWKLLSRIRVIPVLGPMHSGVMLRLSM